MAAITIPSMQESHLLEGTSNFVPWKLRLLNLHVIADLRYLVAKVVVPLTDPQDLIKHNNKAMAAKRILLDTVMNHWIPRITEKNTTKQMYDALRTLYQMWRI